jgi:streptogramin lyase
VTRPAGRLRWLFAFVLACAACPTSAAAAPTVTELTGGVTQGFSANADPEGITVGSDGNIWFAEEGGRVGHVARVNSNGTVNEFLLTSGGHPRGIAADQNGNIWYTEPTEGRVGRRNPNGTFAEFTLGAGHSAPEEITIGPDGNAWFAEGNGIGRVNPNGTVTEFRSGVTPGFSPNTGAWGIATGPDGNIWFTEPISGIARLNPDGTVTEFRNGLSSGGYETVTAGADGNIWYARNGGSHPGVGRVNPNGTVTEFTLGVTPGFVHQTYPEGTTLGSCDRNIWFSEFGTPGGVGRLNPNETVTEFTAGTTPGLSSPGVARRLTSAPDGSIWFAENANPGRIARLTPPPGADTQAPSGVGPHSATLHGEVRPCSQTTSFAFDYGTGTGYGKRTAFTVAGGPLPVAAAETVSGLAWDTVYHYRVVATNHSGTTFSADATFKTPPSPWVRFLGINPAVFAAESRGPSAAAAKKSKRHRGTRITFRLNEAATVRFTVTKRTDGRKVKRGKRKVCVKPTRNNRKHKRCRRVVTLKGSFRIKGVAGKNHFHFTGRLHGKKLPPGRYRLVATPIIGGVAAKPTSTAFRIVR